MTVVTSNTDPSWVPALLELKRVNVTVSIVMVDPSSFGSRFNTDMVMNAAAAELVPVYVAARDGRLDDALARPVNRESMEGRTAVRPYLEPGRRLAPGCPTTPPNPRRAKDDRRRVGQLVIG